MTHVTYEETLTRPAAAWGAVVSMALCVAVLIASEFMPVSLLTPIATDLVMTEGQAGQAISISGLFAVVTSLFIAGITRSIDRKVVLSSFSVLLVASGLIVTFAPNYTVLMIGRALLGIAIGGFWSMSTAIVMRLLPATAVPKGLAILNAGNAIAATISAPLGSFLGDYIGWRGAFFFVVPLALIALVWQWLSMPSLPPRRRSAAGNVFRLLKRRQVAIGMTAILLLFMGQFALFTYLRPFLEFRLRLLRFRLVSGALVNGTRRRGRNLEHQFAAFDAPLPDRGWYSPCHGSDNCDADSIWLGEDCRCGPPDCLGVLWHRRARRLGNLVEQGTSR